MGENLVPVWSEHVNHCSSQLMIYFIFAGFKPFDELQKVVSQRLLLQDIRELSLAEQTSELEAFHKEKKEEIWLSPVTKTPTQVGV